MSETSTVTTERLILRAWRDEDREPFARMNADRRVMAHFSEPLDRTGSDALVDRIRQQWAAEGWGLWALERRDNGQFVGFTGLAPVRFEAGFQPNREIGWRLAAEHWGQGFATEAAQASASYAFDILGWSEIVSFTTVRNVASMRVMERIGMRRDLEGDFLHPGIAEGHPQRPHVLYRLTAEQWRASRSA